MVFFPSCAVGIFMTWREQNHKYCMTMAFCTGDSFMSLHWLIVGSPAVTKRGNREGYFGGFPLHWYQGAEVPHSWHISFFKVKLVGDLDKWRKFQSLLWIQHWTPSTKHLISCLNVVISHYLSIHQQVQRCMTVVLLLRNHIASTFALEKGCVFTSVAIIRNHPISAYNPSRKILLALPYYNRTRYTFNWQSNTSFH